MANQTRWTLLDAIHPSSEESPPESLPTGAGTFQIGWKELTSGLGRGLHVLTINTGGVTAAILPERGMGIWKCWSQEMEVGWQSPIHGPVHPSWVPLYDPSGIGWLEGFDEFLVRCGIESFGAPDFDSKGQLKHPLHGRIANRPAHRLTIEWDPLAGTLDVKGWVDESRFLVRGLSLVAHYQFRIQQPTFSVVDTVTNTSARPTTIQMLYHINVGQPILEAGSSVLIPTRRVSPRNEHAATDIDQWTSYKPPTPGYTEQVYLVQPFADGQGWATTMLRDSHSNHGIAVRFDTKTLPYMTLWKNTAAVEDGYVTGLEPATGFPNPRSFEEGKGRLVTLAAGESRRFRLQIEPITSARRIEEVASEVSKLQTEAPEVLRKPDPMWANI